MDDKTAFRRRVEIAQRARHAIHDAEHTQARQVASNASAALLRLRFEADTTTVYVAPIGRAARRASGDPQVHRMASVDEPLLETLAAG